MRVTVKTPVIITPGVVTEAKMLDFETKLCSSGFAILLNNSKTAYANMVTDGKNIVPA